MIFDIMSEKDAIAFSGEADIYSCVIISIRNPDDSDLCFDNPFIKDVLHLKFYDSEDSLPGAMTPRDARAAAEFACKWSGKVDAIVVHCREGVSRSAGTCAALMRTLTGTDGEVWSDSAYRPNRRCYRLVLAAMNKIRAEQGLPRVFGRTSKGLFWFKSDIEIVKIPLPCNGDGIVESTFIMKNEALSKSEDNYNHERTWATLPRGVTEGKPYNYYPRGRVEIKNKTASVYLNPSLATREYAEMISNEFMLYPECGIERVKIIADGSAHYKSEV